jgi:hypothetical protein
VKEILGGVPHGLERELETLNRRIANYAIPKIASEDLFERSDRLPRFLRSRDIVASVSPRSPTSGTVPDEPAPGSPPSLLSLRPAPTHPEADVVNPAERILRTLEKHRRGKSYLPDTSRRPT